MMVVSMEFEFEKAEIAVKKAFALFFWVLSVFLVLMALALLSGSVLTSAMLLGCAVLIHPIFMEKVQLKKGTTALLAIGLFIGAIAVFPSFGEQTAEQSQEITQMRQAAQSEPEVTTAPLREVLASERTITEANESITPASAAPTITASPTFTPSPEPTPTPFLTEPPTNTPKLTLTPVPVTRSVGIRIVDYSESVRRGAYAFIEILGAPNTDYTCAVEYKTTMSSADGLGAKRSDSDGSVSWRWKVGSRTSLDYMPTIYIDGGGDSISVEFDVTE